MVATMAVTARHTPLVDRGAPFHGCSRRVAAPARRRLLAAQQDWAAAADGRGHRGSLGDQYGCPQGRGHRKRRDPGDCRGSAVAGSRIARRSGRSPHGVVPVSGRRGRDTADLGNVVAPLLVPVPTDGSTHDRLTRVAQHVGAQKELASGPPPIAMLGWLFRPLAALGAYRWYMNHQHRLHTLVTNVRGPRRRSSPTAAR